MGMEKYILTNIIISENKSRIKKLQPSIPSSDDQSVPPIHKDEPTIQSSSCLLPCFHGLSICGEATTTCDRLRFTSIVRPAEPGDTGASTLLADLRTGARHRISCQVHRSWSCHR